MKSGRWESVGTLLAALGMGLLCLLLMGLPWAESHRTFHALWIQPAVHKFSSEQRFKPEQVRELLQATKFEPKSHATLPIAEPPWPAEASLPVDLDRLGRNKSHFVVDSRWALIRFLGPSPAGAGLTGEALNKAQQDALGTKFDSLPVTTAAATINLMMDSYFAPLLSAIPGGEALLPRIKVQGAYFSPLYESTADLPLEFDNAFVVGLQSLQIFPNLCFERTHDVSCKPPFFSTGHDPTVIGHELGHVIFNHLRDEKTMDGFQWFAVNEGYADYFSASFFSDPVIGRIWRVNRTGAPFLRRLLDSPTALDESQSHEAHLFSVVWSSTLWRIRSRLTLEKNAKTFDIDRTFLQSIPFLGETEKPRLGDAATALLKAAEVLGYPGWKKIIQEEMRRSEVSLREPGGSGLTSVFATESTATAEGQSRNQESLGSGCGVLVSHQSAMSGTANPAATAFLLLLPALLASASLIFKRRKFVLQRRKTVSAWLSENPNLPLAVRWFFLVCTAINVSGCHFRLFSPPAAEAKAPGFTLVYACKAEVLEVSKAQLTSIVAEPKEVFISFFPNPDASPTVERVLVSDSHYQESASAIIFLLDRGRRQVDQVRNRDGSPFETNINAQYMDSDTASAHRHIRLGTLILQDASGALAHAPSPIKSSAEATKDILEILIERMKLQVSRANPVTSPSGFGPMPSAIEREGTTVCNLKETRPAAP